MPSLDRWAPYALGLLRIVAALIFFEHGTQKLLGFPARPGGGAGPALFSLYGRLTEMTDTDFRVLPEEGSVPL